MRIVSLLPSATEIVHLIGAGDRLVGRSHECDFPASVGHLPVLTAARAGSEPGQSLDGDLAPSAIDERVRSMSEAEQALYTLDESRLVELEPDLIVTQDVCSVCSIDHATVVRVADGMPGMPRVLSLNPETIEGVLDDILAVGSAAGMEREAMHAVVGLRERADRALEYVNPYTEGPVIGFMEWTNPIYVAGHWSVQLIERAGGRHPLNETVAKPGSGAAVGPQQ
ncbi:MAG: cobalamin-binding protein, partial [Planctomycetota bacterium]